jgi:hypothetical protein
MLLCSAIFNMIGELSTEIKPLKGKLDRQQNFLTAVIFVTCLLTAWYKAFSGHHMIKKFSVIKSKGTYINGFINACLWQYYYFALSNPILS